MLGTLYMILSGINQLSAGEIKVAYVLDGTKPEEETTTGLLTNPTDDPERETDALEEIFEENNQVDSTE